MNQNECFHVHYLVFKIDVEDGRKEPGPIESGVYSCRFPADDGRLPCRAPPVSARLTCGLDDSVTGDQECDRIIADGSPYRPGRIGLMDLTGDDRIGGQLTHGYFQKGLPDLKLKPRALQMQPDWPWPGPVLFENGERVFLKRIRF